MESPFSRSSLQKGYVLGFPTNRVGTPDPERHLSAASCATIRILMHSALLWASSNNEVRSFSINVSTVICINT